MFKSQYQDKKSFGKYTEPDFAEILDHSLLAEGAVGCGLVLTMRGISPRCQHFAFILGAD